MLPPCPAMIAAIAPCHTKINQSCHHEKCETSDLWRLTDIAGHLSPVRVGFGGLLLSVGVARVLV
jgi:hypothetical protein